MVVERVSGVWFGLEIGEGGGEGGAAAEEKRRIRKFLKADKTWLVDRRVHLESNGCGREQGIFVNEDVWLVQRTIENHFTFTRRYCFVCLATEC